jgi:hypothetical protein
MSVSVAANQVTPVQTASGIYSTLTNSIQFQFGTPTTGGNTVVVVIGTATGGCVSATQSGAVTLGVASTDAIVDNFQVATFNGEVNANVSTWIDTNCMANATYINVSKTSNDYFACYAFELPGSWYADQHVYGWNSSGTAFNSNQTLDLPLQAFAIGFVYVNGSQVISPVNTNWTPLTEIQGAAYSATCAYETYSATSNVFYSGTYASSNYNASAVLCFTQSYSAQSAGIGVWRGEGGSQNPNGTIISGQPTSAQAIANIEAYETWINQEVEYILDYQFYAPTSWSNFENCWLGSGASYSYGPSNWGSVLGGRTLCLALSPCAGRSIGSGGTTWAAEAAGTNDAHWTALGNNLIAWGLGSSVIRLGREFNGNWYNWSPAVTGDTYAQYIAGWQHIVTLLRGLTGANFTFMWNPTLGQGNLSSDYLVNWYPGNNYVDICGIDMYDWGDYTSESDVFPVSARTLAQQQTNWNYLQQTTDGLNQWTKFIASGPAMGTPLCFPEYGIQNWASGGTYIGGGDDPYYIQQVEPFVGATAWSAMWEDKDMGLFEADSITASRMCLPDLSRQVFLTEFTTQPFIPIPPVPQLNPMPAGYIAQAVDMNYLATAASFLLNKPITRVHDTVGSQVVQTATAPIVFGVADFDTTSMFNATFPTRLTVKTAGFYKVSYMVSTTTSGTCVVGTYAQITTGSNNPSGAGILTRAWPGYAFGTSSNNRCCPHGGGILPLYLYPGDYVEIYAYSTNTNAELYYAPASYASSDFEMEFVSI